MIWLTRVLRFFPGFAWKLSGGQTAARGAGESCPLSLSHRGIGHQGCLGLTPGPHQTFLCSCWHRSIIKEIERYLGRKLMKVDHPWSLGIDGPGQKVVNDAAWSFVPWELIRSFSWNTERWSQRRYAYCLNMSFEFDCTAEILRLKLSLSWSIRCFNELQDLICPTFWFRASQDRFECRPAVTGIIAMLSADAPIFATSKQSWVLKWANAWRQNWETEVAFSLLRGSNQGVWAWGLCDCTLEDLEWSWKQDANLRSCAKPLWLETLRGWWSSLPSVCIQPMEETPTPKGQLLVPVCPSKSKDSRVDAIGVSMVLSTCSLGLAVSGVCFTKWSQSCSTRKSSRDLESQSVWANDCWCSWRTFASIR